MLKWVVQINGESGEEIARYKSVKEAAKVLGIKEQTIFEKIDKKKKTKDGYYFERGWIEKEELAKKEFLTVEEYLYLHDLKVKDVSERSGVSVPSIYRAMRGGELSENLRKKLELIGIRFEECKEASRNKYTEFRFYGTYNEIEELIVKLLTSKTHGRLVCYEESEAIRISKVMDGMKIAHYVGRKDGLGYFVRYDATIKEEKKC